MKLLEFSKVSQKIFDKRRMEVFTFEQHGKNIVDLTYDPENNQCSSGQYIVEETSYHAYEFVLIPRDWNDPQLPEFIKGEVAFRRMINTLDIRPHTAHSTSLIQEIEDV